ncbi:aarF domain-containing kinase [Galdieria sulphuraria]|uniref:AarF domain-containing kinase n=1 Tax=Galdieria sulphuraria TaxID=130081 RepID=M2XRW6_GALSU|nr:aarF domain-containing kinase [Galdieria sulphuraria]EME26393.1 aarF domain-containing kinase [Galdieria sulphuraria]|eukprot:XP_005702913.1 aarF domain-containing kinase [Galdieria sulphuraria]
MDTRNVYQSKKFSDSEKSQFSYTETRERLSTAEQLLQETRKQGSKAASKTEQVSRPERSYDHLSDIDPKLGSSAVSNGISMKDNTVFSTELLRESLDSVRPRYDPVVATAYFRTRSLDVRKRQIRITVPIMLFLSKVILDWQRGVEKRNRRKRAKEFLSIIASLGPAFIKGGQALSSRPDLLPPEYLEELQKLQDRLPPFPNEVAFSLIESQLKKPVSEIFVKIEPEPVAVASIGQVYKAYLRNGEAVAVKVQRPECEKIIALDIYILRQLSGTLSKALKMLRRDINLQSIIEEFGKLIYEEIDYISEARNGERFRQLYSSIPYVYVPKVYWEYTRDKVLTMEWVDGTRLTDTDKYGMDASRLVETMVRCSLKQMLEVGYFHADPHGGNLMATKDGKLCYLDFGMMSELKPAQRYGIIEAVVHMVNRDFRSLARLYVRLGFLPEDTHLDPIVEALNRALPDVLGASVGELNFKSVIDKLGSVMYRFPFRLPAYYTAIIRCLGVLEGVAIQVDRNFKILNEAYPYIAARLLTDPSPELQDALRDLIFKDGRPRWSRLESLVESASTKPEYDIGAALDLLSDFLLGNKARDIRSHLVEDITTAVDQLFLDIVLYYRQLFIRNISRLDIPILKGNMFSSHSRHLENDTSSEPQLTRSMEVTMKILAILIRSRGLEPSQIAELVRKWVMHAEGRRFGFQLSFGLAEKLSNRLIKLVFDLPDRFSG